MKGAQEGGWMGGLAGLGKGVGGAVLKPAAGKISTTQTREMNLHDVSGAFGIPGYAFKGIYEEVQKTRGVTQEKETSAAEAQMVQGFKEWETTSEEERNLILVRIKRDLEDFETLEG
jgi:hypothetical protein